MLLSTRIQLDERRIKLMKHFDMFLKKAPYHVGVDNSNNDNNNAITRRDLDVNEFKGLSNEFFPQSLSKENEDENSNTLPEKIVLLLLFSFTMANRSLRGITKKIAAMKMQIQQIVHLHLDLQVVGFLQEWGWGQCEVAVEGQRIVSAVE